MTSCKTINIVDPRIEPQPEPLYQRIIAPRQNQYYQIPASGKSDSTINFNNLTTLGTDRAYLDTFEIEITATVTFTCASTHYSPQPDEWTFDSFPFSKCCDTIRVNINGGAFFSQPMSYLRAKERYWNEMAINQSYENICPCNKPHLQDESGDTFQAATTDRSPTLQDYTIDLTKAGANVTNATLIQGRAAPTRLGAGGKGYMPTTSGIGGTPNNSIVRINKYEWNVDGSKLTVEATWREPIFCSPFSSRIDADYGRPLYNITSMDLTFTMQALENMIRLSHIHDAEKPVLGYSVTINNARLCYQVLTLPPTLSKPNTTLVPYRSFIPYITECPQNAGNQISAGGQMIKVTSGVYTLNEIPEAIWVFLAPNKDLLQTNPAQTAGASGDGNLNYAGNWSSNKLFAYLDHISINMANTTQLLNTALVPDLYRIAKQNGCQDSFQQWGIYNGVDTRLVPSNRQAPNYKALGPGSVLRLIPGVDLIIPDQELIPGANANNMVIQVEGEFYIPPHAASLNKYSLWLLFEYVGVAAISPGQCEITMNPIGNGEVMDKSPIVSATSVKTEGTTSGAGFFDSLKRGLARISKWAQDIKLGTRAAAVLPGLIGKINPKAGDIAQTIADGALPLIQKAGYGEIGRGGKKRARIDDGASVVGGAVMGLGDFC